MKVRALRGVCIGVERHLRAGDTAELDPAQSRYLQAIGAVELVPDEPAQADLLPTPPALPGKKEK